MKSSNFSMKSISSPTSSHLHTQLSHTTSTKSMTKAITYLIGLSLASMVVLLIYSGSLWSDFYGSEKQNSTNMTHPHHKGDDATGVDEQQATKKPRGMGGLYETNIYVDEVYSASELNAYKKNEKNLMVVFYASWCGHCRNFVPKFTSVAQKVTTRTRELNEENPLAMYPTTHFLAVNCVTLKTVCDNHKVEYYPNIQIFNFVNTDSKTKTKMEGIESELLKFFSKTIFLHGELEKKSSAAKTNSKVVSPASPTPRPVVKLSHSTENAEDRIHDALSSFLFFLMNELPEELTQERVTSLLSMVNMISMLLPSSTHKVSSALSSQMLLSQSVFSNAKITLYKYSKSPFLPRKKLLEAISPAFKSSKPNEEFPPKTEWKVCGVIAQPASTLRGRKQKINGDPGTGYSCGLWLLFHYLTLQGEVVHVTQPTITAVSVMLGIYSFVENFFGCNECRAHFLQYYNLSLFRRNMITTDNDFPQLQLWLFQLHNLVSSRIRLEKTYGLSIFADDSTNATLVLSKLPQYQELIYASLWPTRKQCLQCYNTNNTKDLLLKESAVLAWEDIIRPTVETSFLPEQTLEYTKKVFLLP